MRFGVLGTLHVQGTTRRLAGPMQRRLLGLLLVEANHVVPLDTLTDGLWSRPTSKSTIHRVHLLVHRIRSALEDPERLATDVDGYLLRAQPDELDLLMFESLERDASTAIAAGEAFRGTSLLRQALGLWRGHPFTGLGDAPVFRENAMRLCERRLNMLEQLHAVEIGRGVHAAAVAELRDLVTHHPLRERLWMLLMIALYRSGRRAEALAAYREIAGHLAEELGIDPDKQLQALHQAMLTAADPTLDAPLASVLG